MRDVLVTFVALLTRNAVARRCVFADLYTCFIYNNNRLKLAGSCDISTKLMDAQRRTALFFVTQGVGCASCMCDWDISFQCEMRQSSENIKFIHPNRHWQNVRLASQALD